MDYTKYSDKAIRNDPKDELEEQYADDMAEDAASKIIDKYIGEPMFLKAIALKVAEYAVKEGL